MGLTLQDEIKDLLQRHFGVTHASIGGAVVYLDQTVLAEYAAVEDHIAEESVLFIVGLWFHQGGLALRDDLGGIVFVQNSDPEAIAMGGISSMVDFYPTCFGFKGHGAAADTAPIPVVGVDLHQQLVVAPGNQIGRFGDPDFTAAVFGGSRAAHRIILSVDFPGENTDVLVVRREDAAEPFVILPILGPGQPGGHTQTGTGAKVDVIVSIFGNIGDPRILDAEFLVFIRRVERRLLFDREIQSVLAASQAQVGNRSQDPEDLLALLIIAQHEAAVPKIVQRIVLFQTACQDLTVLLGIIRSEKDVRILVRFRGLGHAQQQENFVSHSVASGIHDVFHFPSRARRFHVFNRNNRVQLGPYDIPRLGRGLGHARDLRWRGILLIRIGRGGSRHVTLEYHLQFPRGSRKLLWRRP